jgi:hypothetical protein
MNQETKRQFKVDGLGLVSKLKKRSKKEVFVLKYFKVGAMALLLLTPALVFAWPQPGDPAPDVSVPDTAWVTHLVPSEYRGQVVQLFFWQST